MYVVPVQMEPRAFCLLGMRSATEPPAQGHHSCKVTVTSHRHSMYLVFQILYGKDESEWGSQPTNNYFQGNGIIQCLERRCVQGKCLPAEGTEGRRGGSSIWVCAFGVLAMQTRGPAMMHQGKGSLDTAMALRQQSAHAHASAQRS